MNIFGKKVSKDPEVIEMHDVIESTKARKMKRMKQDCGDLLRIFLKKIDSVRSERRCCQISFAF